MELWTIDIRTPEYKNSQAKTIQASDLTMAKQQCLCRIRQRLKGKNKLYLESRGNGKYLIVSDMQEIGEVEIHRKT